MTQGNSSAALVNGINSFVRHFRGGLGIVVVISCAFFATMCGSALATAAAIGMTMEKLMAEKGYPKELTAAIVSSGAILGPIIPPSIWMIVYCGMAEVNVAKMFLAGFLPGIILAGFLSVVVWSMAVRKKIPTEAAASWKERKQSFGKSIAGMITPFIVLGGIYGGIFTPTEAGAVCCVWALIIGVYYYKGIKNYKNLFTLSRDAAYSSASILILVSGALLFGEAASRIGIASMISNFVKSVELTSTQFLLLYTVILLILGCFLELFCIMVITVPLLFPAAVALKIDPLHFGMVLIFGLGVGQLTPPVGITVYTVAKFMETPSGPVFKVVTPFTISMILVMLLVVFFPQLSLWLPKVWMG
jgi:C4-dicarboxylate transporter DctM subunit